MIAPNWSHIMCVGIQQTAEQYDLCYDSLECHSDNRFKADGSIHGICHWKIGAALVRKGTESMCVCPPAYYLCIYTQSCPRGC